MIDFFPAREVAVNIFNYPVYWYGLLYVTSFLLAILLLPVLQKRRHLDLNRHNWTEFTSLAAIGVILGGRIGYVLLYEPVIVFSNPLQILNIREGGMSSHGGFIGVALAVWLYVRYFMPLSKNNLSPRSRIFLLIMDLIVIPAALGLSLGRIGNIINQELFPTPAAKIMAVGSGLIISASCYLFLKHLRPKPGSVLALFLILYSVFRLFIEFYRVQNYPDVLGMTRGQIYTLPLLVAGIALAVYVRKDKQKTDHV